MGTQGKNAAYIRILVDRIIMLNQLMVVFQNFVFFVYLSYNVRYSLIVVTISELCIGIRIPVKIKVEIILFLSANPLKFITIVFIKCRQVFVDSFGSLTVEFSRRQFCNILKRSNIGIGSRFLTDFIGNNQQIVSCQIYSPCIGNFIFDAFQTLKQFWQPVNFFIVASAFFLFSPVD